MGSGWSSKQVLRDRPTPTSGTPPLYKATTTKSLNHQGRQQGGREHRQRRWQRCECPATMRPGLMTKQYPDTYSRKTPSLFMQMLSREAKMPKEITEEDPSGLTAAVPGADIAPVQTSGLASCSVADFWSPLPAQSGAGSGSTPAAAISPGPQLQVGPVPTPVAALPTLQPTAMTVQPADPSGEVLSNTAAWVVARRIRRPNAAVLVFALQRDTVSMHQGKP